MRYIKNCASKLFDGRLRRPATLLGGFKSSSSPAEERTRFGGLPEPSGEPSKRLAGAVLYTFFFFSVLLPLSAWAVPDQPFTLIFKDIVRHEQVRLVELTMQQMKKVDGFVMRRAQRNFILYEGLYEGRTQDFLETFQKTFGKRFDYSESVHSGHVEIVLKPAKEN